MLPLLMPLLRRDKELAISDDQTGLLLRRSAATIDRKLAGEREKTDPARTVPHQARHGAHVRDRHHRITFTRSRPGSKKRRRQRGAKELGRACDLRRASSSADA